MINISNYLSGMSQIPPPTPPPPTLTRTASTTAEQSGWRLPRGQDYWERALSSFYPATPPQLPPPMPAPQEQVTNPDLYNNNSTVNCTVSNAMDTTTNIKLSTAYYQTHNTR